ncbi:hypothetical protein [uncultured Lacinutrix sp.]|uniref:hypothetical protein n=1 Tax=uncultured Lacinutrix sp. TaxID=574032 RepID=UPI002630ADDF|nr:hypothetical protein [uncultured Lacinutrix sp.]
MQDAPSHTAQIIKLNGERITRTYTSEIVNTIEKAKHKSYSAVGLEFDFTFYGKDKDGLLNYNLEVKKRVLLNEKLNAIRKLNKAQKIAIKVATINNILKFKVDKNFKLNKVVNTNEIRTKWTGIKAELLNDFPDLSKMIADFDWQLKEENIQRVFLEDNFYNFFFSNVFYAEFDNKKLYNQSKTIANGVNNINIPIIEQRKIIKQDLAFTDVTIQLNSEMDSNNEKFPISKLNTFIGSLPSNIGENYMLDFDYKGIYKIKPEYGLVTQGTLNYTFNVEGLYKKTTTITFNLEKDE